MVSRCCVLFLCLSFASAAWAVDHKLEALDEPPPTEGVAEEIAKTLESKGVRIVRGKSRTICDVWLCKEWATGAGKPSGDVIYPFQPGQLIGLVRYPKKGSDFRDQDIADGVYTLRYGQQPVDGAHVGTSPVRDFLLLLKADEDKSLAAPDYKTLTKASARAADSNHPLLWSMQRQANAGAEAAALRHDEPHEWWIATLVGKLKQGAEAKRQAIDVVIVGKAAE